MFDDLAKPEYRQTLEYSNASNKDIRSVIHKNFPRAVQQTKSFASRFRADTARQTAYNVWKFLKDHITYSKDDESAQIVRLPSRFVGSDCTGDCKSYSLTAASLLSNLGLPVAFRYAGYNGNTTTPTHVYVVTKDESGKEIIVDGVWKYFDSEKKPSLKFDEAMNVYTLSGTEDGIGRRGNIFKKFVRANKRIALAPSRRAFRTLVALNVFGLARKLHALETNAPGKAKKLWVDRLGGTWPQLHKSIRAGFNRWAKRHKKPKISGIDIISCCAGIGFPPAIAAYVTAASAIIPVFTSAFKKGGVKDEPGEATGEQTAQATQQAQQDMPQAQAVQAIEGIEGRHRLKDFIRKQRKRRKKFMHRFGPPGLRDDVSGLGKAKWLKKISLKNIARGAKKISLAPNRRAFRTMVALNTGGLALKLARVHNSKDRNDLKKKWEKIGGKYSELLKSIKAGMKRAPAKKRFAINAAAATPQQKSNATGYAALAAAVIKLFASLFKKHEQASDSGDVAMDSQGNPLPGETTIDKIIRVAEGAASAAGESSESADEQLQEGKAEAGADESDEPSAAGFSESPLLIGGLGIAAIMMFTGKRK